VVEENGFLEVGEIFFEKRNDFLRFDHAVHVDADFVL